MSGDVVNLNKVRKAKARLEKTASARTNRVKFGRAKPQTMAEKLEAERAQRALDQHQRAPGPGAPTDED